MVHAAVRCRQEGNFRIESFGIWTFMAFTSFYLFMAFTVVILSLFLFLPSLLLLFILLMAFTLFALSLFLFLLSLLLLFVLLMAFTLFALSLFLFLRSFLLSLLLSLLLFEKWFSPGGEVFRAGVSLSSVVALEKHVRGHCLGDQGHDGVPLEFL